ncbi:MAG: alpha/beta hydrolase [Bacteroidota bacterium]
MNQTPNKQIGQRLLLFILLLGFLMGATNANAQSKTDTSITYIHPKPASFKSQLYQIIMSVAGLKNGVGKTIKSKAFSHHTAPLPQKLTDNYHVSLSEKQGRKIWTIQPLQQASNTTILYLHGGAYMANLIKFHWDFIEALVRKTNATVIVPDYPLAPHANCMDVYAFITEIYKQWLQTTPAGHIVIMGDSAGGGLALGFAENLKKEHIKQPSQIILLSPWLDITMSNPDIRLTNKKDKMLEINSLQAAGQMYAANLQPTNYLVSPIYGDFSGLGKISLFIGTHDILVADARKFKQMAMQQQIAINYFEYPKMFHVWMVVTNLKESQNALEQVVALIKNEE